MPLSSEAQSFLWRRKSYVSTKELFVKQRTCFVRMRLRIVCSLQVPFEVLVRRQIARLLEPSLQCARFIYDELVKVQLMRITSYIHFSYSALVNFPLLVRTELILEKGPNSYRRVLLLHFLISEIYSLMYHWGFADISQIRVVRAAAFSGFTPSDWGGCCQLFAGRFSTSRNHDRPPDRNGGTHALASSAESFSFQCLQIWTHLVFRKNFLHMAKTVANAFYSLLVQSALLSVSFGRIIGRHATCKFGSENVVTCCEMSDLFG